MRGLLGIEAAVYAVGGWSDGYTNAIPRLLEGLPGPRKGLIGPWSHAWPQAGPPGPAIGFLQEMLRWFDHWLGGVDTGIMDEPMLRAYIQDSFRPASCYAERPGRWVAEPAWPAPGVGAQRLHLNPDGLGRARRRARPSCASRACRRPASTPARGARTASRPTGRATSGRWTG